MYHANSAYHLTLHGPPVDSLNIKELTVASIDFIQREAASTDICLAIEYPFLAGKRRADILVKIKNYLWALEIKSADDSINTLDAQLLDYKNTFHRVDIIINWKHYKKVRKENHKSVGIIIERDGKLYRVRKSKKRVVLKKENVVSLLNRNNINKLCTAYSIDKSLEIFKKRQIISEIVHFTKIEESALNSIDMKIADDYALFMKEHGKVMHQDDLLLISQRN